MFPWLEKESITTGQMFLFFPCGSSKWKERERGATPIGDVDGLGHGLVIWFGRSGPLLVRRGHGR